MRPKRTLLMLQDYNNRLLWRWPPREGHYQIFCGAQHQLVGYFEKDLGSQLQLAVRNLWVKSAKNRNLKFSFKIKKKELKILLQSIQVAELCSRVSFKKILIHHITSNQYFPYHCYIFTSFGFTFKRVIVA